MSTALHPRLHVEGALRLYGLISGGLGRAEFFAERGLRVRQAARPPRRGFRLWDIEGAPARQARWAGPGLYVQGMVEAGEIAALGARFAWSGGE